MQLYIYFRPALALYNTSSFLLISPDVFLMNVFYESFASVFFIFTTSLVSNMANIWWALYFAALNNVTSVFSLNMLETGFS